MNANFELPAPIPVVLGGDRHEQLNQFLRFHLLPNMTAVMPAGQLTEILKVSLSQITPIPHLPEWVFGVYNWRGEILWLVDLGNLLGLTSWRQQENPPSVLSFIVLDSFRESDASARHENLQLGLLVNRVEDIEWLNIEQLQSPPSSMVTEQLAPFLCGYWLSPNGDTLTLLDGDAIFDRVPT
ncbi:MAG: CheW domain-containing protein [Leptolyngbyaceae bacterium]|nr:CheW domain-containing protein [Leptolyngbyaceae bacterium]